MTNTETAKKYVVSSHWNAETSRLHGKSFDSLEDALEAIGSDVVDEGWGDVDGEGRECQAIGVYGSEEDREVNAEGGAPHRALATIRVVVKVCE